MNKKNLIGAEIGVFEGEHALEMLQNLPIKKLYLIDPYDSYGEYYEISNKVLHTAKQKAGDLLIKFASQIEFVQGQAAHVVNVIPDNLDFVYIDGNHAYKYVLLDLETYWPKVLDTGGVLCGHDYNNNNIPGVTQAVNEFAKKSDLYFIQSNHDWWLIKWKQ